MGPFEGAVTREDIVAHIEANPIEGSPDEMRAAFERLTLGEARDPYDRVGGASVLGSPVVVARVDGGSLTVLPALTYEEMNAVGGGERYVPDRLVVWFHGGGYVFGSPETHLRPAARLSTMLGVPVLLPRYPLAPERRWPAQLDHALSIAGQALAAPSPRTSDGQGRVVLAGDSAGGHLALVAALELARRGRPPAGLLLLAPNTDRTGLSDTREAMTPRDPMNADEDDRALARLCFGGMPDDHRHVSPVLDDLALLPPTYIEVGDPEVLLDDSRILAARANDAGADVSLHVEPGFLHMGQLWAPWWDAAEASLGRCAERARAWLKDE